MVSNVVSLDARKQVTVLSDSVGNIQWKSDKVGEQAHTKNA